MTDEPRTEDDATADPAAGTGALVTVPPRPPARRLGAAAGLAGVGVAVLALAVGALAIGALAIGTLAVGRLGVGRARIRSLEIDELIVRRVTEKA